MNATKTILVTSHDRDQFGMAASLFEDNGYRVIFEQDVQQSLKIAKAERPKLIISELAVPNIDGPHFCRRVRENRTLEEIPIVLVGDLSRQSSIVADTLRSGASDYLQKPFDQLRLFELCREVESVGISANAPAVSRSLNSCQPRDDQRREMLDFDTWEIIEGLICVN